jgi:M6 family metalloprotease-like protein
MTKIGQGIGFLIVGAIIGLAAPSTAIEGKIMTPLKIERGAYKNNLKIARAGFHSSASKRNILKIERDKPWSLPKATAAAAGGVDTLRILAMRFDFRYENPDDPNTTGRGRFDMRDTLQFFEEEGHFIDPSPHTKAYFERHIEALNYYYNIVSEGKLVIVGDVYPEESDSVYHLPRTMGYYGSQGADRAFGLEELSWDAIRLVDSAEPEIVFSDYDTYMIFHAGSDRQNDIGFPETPYDLFTGNVFLGDNAVVPVDNGQDSIRDVMVMPETACQDNRGTALNAVMAHEYGHQLGLVDLYSTSNFLTQVGDFSLMDNNGFGTGVDFGFEVGRIFGVMPIYPDAWSRAFLGFTEVKVYRQGTDIQLVAAEMSREGVKTARVPISQFEYYLLENRQIEVDGAETALLADSATSVILGPVNRFTKEFSREYDFLIPGSGIIIWHVDERVAQADWDGDGYNNFEENMLQINPQYRFIEVMEADGLINFGGNYYSGFGDPEDMYFEGNNTSFTPNTNPASIGYSGVNSHIRITGISASDTLMYFDLENDLTSPGFPRRAGYPVYSLSPIAADLDNDGYDEIIAASNRNILAIKQDGSDFMPLLPVFIDTSYSLSGKTADTVPLFGRTQYSITAGPVAGDFGKGADSMRVAVGAGNLLYIFGNRDSYMVGEADLIRRISFAGDVLSIIFADSLIVAEVNRRTNGIRLYYVDSEGAVSPASPAIFAAELYGVVKLSQGIALVTGDSITTRLYMVSPSNDTTSLDLGGKYYYGPLGADLNRDNNPEIIAASPDGEIVAATVNYLESTADLLEIYNRSRIDDSIGANIAAADIDEDGYADIIIGGKNKIHALDRNFISLTDFPIVIDKEYPANYVLSAPIVADINGDKHQDIIAVAGNGNCYAFGPEPLYGFPLAAGGVGVGPAVAYKRGDIGGLGIMGVDGWFYSYDVAFDTLFADWPMGGGDMRGSFCLDAGKLGEPRPATDNLPASEFYCYPNPSLNGHTTIRCRLGESARLTLTFYDLSGREVDKKEVSGEAGTNEHPWDASFLPTGVYRCLLEADFGNEIKSAFTDIAIVK